MVHLPSKLFRSIFFLNLVFKNFKNRLYYLFKLLTEACYGSKQYYSDQRALMLY